MDFNNCFGECLYSVYKINLPEYEQMDSVYNRSDHIGIHEL
jgi:hypothetical protein